jgi:hypothetical protein
MGLMAEGVAMYRVAHVHAVPGIEIFFKDG